MARYMVKGFLRDYHTVMGHDETLNKLKQEAMDGKMKDVQEEWSIEGGYIRRGKSQRLRLRDTHPVSHQ